MLRLAPFSEPVGTGAGFHSTHQQHVDKFVYTLPGVHQYPFLAVPDQVAVGSL